VKFQRGEMVAPRPPRSPRMLGLVVEVETDFFSHPVADNMDRVWVRWFDPALGIMGAEAWPSTALTRP